MPKYALPLIFFDAVDVFMNEVENGLKMMEGSGIPAQIKLLKIEGCVETEVFNNHNEFSEEWRNILTKYPSKNGN